jgi:hypothetical protein
VAKTDEKVMRMVEQELAKNPEASGDELFDKAKKLNAGIARMTRRQFHARYPLQVKRKKGAGRKGRKGRKGAKKATAAKTGRRGPGRPRGSRGDHREAVRQVFLRFAQDVAGADTPAALVKLILNVDRYVDEAVKGR